MLEIKELFCDTPGAKTDKPMHPATFLYAHFFIKVFIIHETSPIFVLFVAAGSGLRMPDVAGPARGHSGRHARLADCRPTLHAESEDRQVSHTHSL